MKARMTLFIAALALIAATFGSGPGDAFGQVKGQGANALMDQAQAALDAKRWLDAVGPLQQLISADPACWECFQKLGVAQFNLARYEDAVRSCEKGIGAAQSRLSNAGEPGLDKIKEGLGRMYTQQGNAYIRLRRNNEAVAAFTRAAEFSPNKSIAYFNICATLYNIGDMVRAEPACQKAIDVDPSRADAYFVLGAVKLGKGAIEPKTNKFRAPPGTAEVLRKYLELAPNGAHAKEVKDMLEFIGENK